ncbi:ABC transporter ATP-binding protein [Bombiscardovia nodaiensis]|uniref:ABC transporter ATP-binding protein n=1 Tax=Bombiscardovia nodaiensis TaxID=2932181 RepID=A0ABN6SAS2_9BIFI|nr:ABC transporter ATP-binding protein [Bombiscardovia nodaiensis]
MSSSDKSTPEDETLESAESTTEAKQGTKAEQNTKAEHGAQSEQKGEQSANEAEQTHQTPRSKSGSSAQAEAKPAVEEEAESTSTTQSEEEDEEAANTNSAEEEGPEFKVVIEDESVEDEEDEDDPLTSLEPDIDELDLPVPNGYPVLELRHVSLAPRSKGVSQLLLDDVNMAFRVRRTHYVQAQSAEHLSAFMALVSGLMAPSEGNVLYRGTDIRQIESSDYRGHEIGLIFAQDALRTDMSAIENAVYTMDASGRTFLKPMDTLARDLLEEMNFPERLEQRPVRELSRIDYVRAALARAICCECDVLVAQELMSGLDSEENSTILALLAKTARRHDCAVILASVDAPGEGDYDQTYQLK